MGVPHVVGSLEHIGKPADLSLCVHQPEIREAMENPRKKEVGKAGHAIAKQDRRRYGNRTVRRCLGSLGTGTDVHTHDSSGLLAGRKEGIPVSRIDAGKSKVRWHLRKGHGSNTTGGVTPDLSYGQLAIPEGNETERNQAPSAAPTPLLDHPVV